MTAPSMPRQYMTFRLLNLNLRIGKMTPWVPGGFFRMKDIRYIWDYIPIYN